MTTLPLDAIEPDPDNVRSVEGDAEIASLAASIQQNGLLHPIVVYPIAGGNGRHRISGGHRRFVAVTRLGWETVPVTVIDPPATVFDRLDLMAAENLQRKQLDPIERALLFKRYLDRGARQKDVAERLHLSQSTISSLLPLLDLPAAVQEQIRSREISWQQAVKLGIKNRNEGGRRHGTYGARRTEGARVPHFNTQHPLHQRARDRCCAAAHPTYKWIGGACGPCWEQVIREDARSTDRDVQPERADRESAGQTRRTADPPASPSPPRPAPSPTPPSSPEPAKLGDAHRPSRADTVPPPPPVPRAAPAPLSAGTRRDCGCSIPPEISDAVVARNPRVHEAGCETAIDIEFDRMAGRGTR